VGSFFFSFWLVCFFCLCDLWEGVFPLVFPSLLLFFWFSYTFVGTHFCYFFLRTPFMDSFFFLPRFVPSGFPFGFDPVFGFPLILSPSPSLFQRMHVTSLPFPPCPARSSGVSFSFFVLFSRVLACSARPGGMRVFLVSDQGFFILGPRPFLFTPRLDRCDFWCPFGFPVLTNGKATKPEVVPLMNFFFWD